MVPLSIALGGAAGALARYGVGLVVTAESWPWGTLAVNLVGSFFAGLLVEWGAARLPDAVGAGLTVGLLGGFTTFSALSVQTVELVRLDRPLAAAGYVAATMVLGLAAAGLGLLLGLRIR